jgi:hypothetical protein
MRSKQILVTILALGAVVAVGFLAYRLEAPRGPALCQVCGRNIPKETAYRLDTSDGPIKACCPSCAMHYTLHNPDAVRKSWATDFNSGQRIPASSAYYDEGGDVQYCTARHPPVERGSEGVAMRVYDRCLPTLVAFETRDAAEVYRKQHGGRVLSYDESLMTLRAEQPSHP